MNTSDQINELAAALAKAQGAMKNAAMNRINPHYKSRYADLAAVFDAARGPLSANGLSTVQTIGPGVLHTRLLHTSGQWIASEHPLPTSGRPQEIGSALTYARRYSLCALIGIAADEDDDATAAEKAHKVKGNGISAGNDDSKLTDEQIDQIRSRVIAIANDPIKVLARVVLAVGHKELVDVPASKFDDVMAKINLVEEANKAKDDSDH